MKRVYWLVICFVLWAIGASFILLYHDTRNAIMIGSGFMAVAIAISNLVNFSDLDEKIKKED